MVVAVCSPKPRPSLQKGPKGSQWWARDVWHIWGEAGKTLCGRNAYGWLTIGDIPVDSDTCTKCVKSHTKKLAVQFIQDLIQSKS